MTTTPERVAALAALLAAAAIAVAVWTWRGPREASGGEVQRILGGVGLGATTTPFDCPGGFDPRHAPECALRHGPVLGADALCAEHVLAPWTVEGR